MANIIMATSRGFGVEPHLSSAHTRVYSHPGQSLAFLTHKAVQHIHALQRTSTISQSIHVYFMAGLCDITYKDEIPAKQDRPKYYKGPLYQEVIYTETPKETLIRMKTQIANTAQQIKNAGAVPCFCTIPPCSISKWNNKRLSKHRTTHLLHHRQYKDMQGLLQHAITDINKHIVETNIQNDMFTPKIADTIIRKKSSKRSYRTYYTKLRDGVHATTDTDREWGDIFKQAMQINRTPHPLNHTESKETQTETEHAPPHTHQDTDENGETLDYWMSESEGSEEDSGQAWDWATNPRHH